MNTDILLAQKLYEGGDDIAAQEKCLTLLDNNETASEAYLLLSQISFDREDYDTSLRYLSEVEEKNLSTLKHHYLAGLNHYACSDFPKARSSFEAVLTIDPGNIDGLRNLGVISKEEGNSLEAATLFCEALSTAPSDQLTRRNLFNALEAINWEGVSSDLLGEIRRHLEAAIKLPEFDLKRYVPIAARVIFSSEPIVSISGILGPQPSGKKIRSLNRDWVLEVSRDRLLQGILRSAVLTGPEFERILTAIRRWLLEVAAFDEDLRTVVPLEFCVSMAHQAYLTEYAYYAGEGELNILKKIWDALLGKVNTKQGLQNSDRVTLAISASYISLGDWMKEIPDTLNEGPIGTLFKSQILDKRVEEGLLSGIEALTSVTDATSVKVQKQYEENPFPRWSVLSPIKTSTVGETLQSLFPYFKAPEKLFERCSILIPGCGTGQQPIQEALRYPTCQLTAIDLSARSLAFAMRRSDEYGISNLRFLQGDILNLKDGEGQFDVINCTGVLHHMADPIAGWKILLSSLSPDGLMKIGLYSEYARRHVVDVRQWISTQNLQPTEDAIRETRRLILDTPEGDAKRHVLSYRDFYSISGARDLMFHVEEHTFTFPEIDDALRNLGLECIGLQLSRPEIGETYKRMFPGDPNMTNFHNWHDFEKIYPDSFSSMYQFWCRRSG